jgi:hypothetical protein
MAAVVARTARGPRIGIALSADAVCAALRTRGRSNVRAWRAALTPLNGDGSVWPGLAEALRALARDTHVVNGRLTVALMPPLAEARGVELPPLGEREAQQVLARGAGKFFASARGAQIVGAVRPPRGQKGNAVVSTVAAAAGARLVNAISEAATAAGWTVEAIIPAEAAWSAAAASWTPRGRGKAQLLVAHDDRTDLLSVDNARLSGLRRFRTGADDATLIADAYSPAAGRITIVGSAGARHELMRLLSARGLAVESPPGAGADIAEHPDLLAAAFATPDATPSLVTDSMRAAHDARVRHATVRIVAAACIFALASGVLEWWGLRRELDSIRAQRAAIAPQISSTLVGRTTVENAFRQLAVLGAEERSSPHWSVALGAISQRLPADAFLTGFRGRGDSVSVDGLAERAARVFDAIERVPNLTGVRSAGPVRIEPTEDGPPLERFAIAARLAPPKNVVRGGTSK